MGEKNWLDLAYVNPLLILEASWASICKSPRFLPLPYVQLLFWNMNSMHISKLHLQGISSHQIGLFSKEKMHSYQALDLMGHPSWNDNTMLNAWKFKHNHLKLQCISKLPFSHIVETICYALFLKSCKWACSQIPL